MSVAVPGTDDVLHSGPGGAGANGLHPGGGFLLEGTVLRGLLRSGLALHCRDTARGKRALTFVLFENAMRGGIPAMDGSTLEKYEF